jgi:uncharacterized membrane protein SpoIIM required for sporulation
MSSSSAPDPSTSRVARGIDREETPTEELARLLDEAEGHRVRALPFDDLRRIARLYRGESARLSRLRDRAGELYRIDHLNSLCVRSHGFRYSAGERRRRGTSLGRLMVSGLARTSDLRRLAWAIMGIGALLGYCLVRLDPSALYALMPSGLGYDVTQIDALYRSPEARALFFERESTSVSANAAFGSYLFSHNTRVGILAFATGALAGLPTLLLQLYNGIMIGTIGAIFLPGDHALLFLAWILPHAVPELTAITFCTAGGLTLGRAVAIPGRLSRGEALRKAGPDALVLAIASVPLFFAAAWIESFVRESALGTAPRFAIAALGAVLLLGLGFALRRAPTDHETSESEWLDRLLERHEPDATRAQATP